MVNKKQRKKTTIGQHLINNKKTKWCCVYLFYMNKKLIAYIQKRRKIYETLRIFRKKIEASTILTVYTWIYLICVIVCCLGYDRIWELTFTFLKSK